MTRIATRPARRPLRFILLAITTACAAAGAARAQVLTPPQLVPAMNAVIDARIEERGLLLACPGVDARVRGAVPAAWTDMRRTLAALLWASDFPADFVRGAIARTDPARLPAATPAADACDSEDMAKRRVSFAADAWSGELRFMFKGLQLPSTTPAPSDEQWSRVRAVVAREAPAQAKLVNCLAVAAANLLPITLADWAKSTAEARLILYAGGFPRDEVAALFDPLAPNILLKPQADRSAARIACLKDTSWQDRFAQFNTGAILFDIREIVTGKR